MHLFKRRVGGKSHTIARAKLASAELSFLAGLDFLITYSWTAWRGLTIWQKLALVDHELSHCARDDEKGWVILPHDVEEFHVIARRWGDWEPGLTTLRRQLELFAGAPQEKKRR